MWLFIECWRRTLPVAFTLKRFAAPRWVFCLGTLVTSRLSLGESHFLRPFGGGGPDDQVHPVARHLGRGLDDAVVADVLGHPIQQSIPQIGARHLPAAELDRGLDLVALVEEAQQVAHLEVVVVVVDVGAELDLLDLEGLLLLPRLLGLLLLLVEELAEVHDAADRRARGRRHLDQVEALLLGQAQRLVDQDDAQLRSIGVDQAHFAGADRFVDAGRLVDAQLTSWELSKPCLKAHGSCPPRGPARDGGNPPAARRPGPRRCVGAPPPRPPPPRGRPPPACTAPSAPAPRAPGRTGSRCARPARRAGRRRAAAPPPPRRRRRSARRPAAPPPGAGRAREETPLPCARSGCPGSARWSRTWRCGSSPAGAPRRRPRCR